MRVVSSLLDCLCMAIYLRGHRAWMAPRVREAEKNRPVPMSQEELARHWARIDALDDDAYADEIIRLQTAAGHRPSSRSYLIASRSRRNKPSTASPTPLSGECAR
jgi:hypothetical protein